MSGSWGLKKIGRSYASIEPDQDLLWLVRVCRWPEPEVQLSITVAPDGQLPGITLSGIEVDLGDCAAIDGELCR